VAFLLAFHVDLATRMARFAVTHRWFINSNVQRDAVGALRALPTM